MGQPSKLELMIGPTDCGLLLAAGTAGAAVRSLAWMLQLRGANWGPNQFSQAHRPSAAVRMQSGLKEVRRSVDTKCWDETVSSMRGRGGGGSAPKRRAPHHIYNSLGFLCRLKWLHQNVKSCDWFTEDFCFSRNLLCSTQGSLAGAIILSPFANLVRFCLSRYFK